PGQLLEPLPLLLVLLLREWVDAAETLAAALEPDEPFRERFAVVAVCRLGPGLLEAPPRRRLLGLEPCQLDIDRRRSFGSFGRGAAELGLSAASSRSAAAASPVREPPASTRARRAASNLSPTCAAPASAWTRRSPALMSRGLATGVTADGFIRSSSTSRSSARRRASSSSQTASAVSPANHSSPRLGSYPNPSEVTAGAVDARSSSFATTA